MQPSSNIAFKEWAIIVDALGRGQQVIILRKGGIIEDKGKFTVDHDQFWLFPTLFHQQMESVVPAARVDFEQLKNRFQSGGTIQLQYLARVENTVEITDLHDALALRGQHIWNDSVIEDRFGYGKNNGIHLLLVRLYRLSAPVTMPMLPGYAGCKSWVELERALPTAELTPVLSDSEFARKALQVLAAL